MRGTRSLDCALPGFALVPRAYVTARCSNANFVLFRSPMMKRLVTYLRNVAHLSMEGLQVDDVISQFER